MGSPSNRRLVAILAADVAGYSRLIGLDEEGTIAALRAVRSEVIDVVIERHGGRIANTAGDSFLIEFRSSVDAVRAAIEIQTALEDRNAGAEPDRVITLRIGLNVGDVVSNDQDILGDGVNVAARLEQLAEPGGIVASETIANYARSNISASFVPMGVQKVKNIAEPIEAFRVELGSATRAKPKKWRMRRWGLVTAGILICAIALGGLFFGRPWDRTAARASEARMAFPLPDLPSVAVLPIANHSGESAHTTLADGFSEDLITDLSRISGLFVIAGNTSAAYRDQEINIAGFAEELGVRYVVDGSLRRTDAAFRVNIRLTDTSNGRLLWAERFDGDLEELFEVQARIVLAFAQVLELTLDDKNRVEIERIETSTIDAHEAFQRGWELYSKFNEEDNIAAIPHFEEAVALDPEYGRAWAALALAHLRPHIFHHWTGFYRNTNQMHIGLFNKYYRKVAQYDTALINVIRAIVLLNLHDWDRTKGPTRGLDEARQAAAKAIARQPSDPEAHLTMGWVQIAAGKPEEGLVFVHSAMRLDPKHPSHYVLFEAAGLFSMGDLESATNTVLEELKRNPQAKELMPVAASFLALGGYRRAAREMVDRWHSGEPADMLSAAVQKYFFIVRWVGEYQHLNRQLTDGLRLAALPPGTTVASLRASLLRGDATQQRATLRALSLFGPDAAPAVPELTDMLGNPSAFLRKEAALALGKIGAAASPALAAISDESLVGKYAANAIEQIRGATD